MEVIDVVHCVTVDSQASGKIEGAVGTVCTQLGTALCIKRIQGAATTSIVENAWSTYMETGMCVVSCACGSGEMIDQ